MFRQVRASLLLRTTGTVLAAVLVVGVVAMILAGRIAHHWERVRQREILEAQMDGVEAVASAACFVEDRGLAEQIVQRLVATRMVQSATLASTTTVLAVATRGHPDPDRVPPPVRRRMRSPFLKEVQVGELVLVPDAELAQRLDRRTALLLRVLVLGLTGTLGAALAFTLKRSIVRPIALLSNRLHGLDPETGALLFVPPGHEGDEIGALVGDVNALLERLVCALRREQAPGESLGAGPWTAQGPGSETGLFVADREGLLKGWTPAFARLLGPEGPVQDGRFPALFGGQRERVEGWLAHCQSLGARPGSALRLRSPDGAGERWLQLSLEPIGADLVLGLLALENGETRP